MNGVEPHDMGLSGSPPARRVEVSLTPPPAPTVASASRLKVELDQGIVCWHICDGLISPKILEVKDKCGAQAQTRLASPVRIRRFFLCFSKLVTQVSQETG